MTNPQQILLAIDDDAAIDALDTVCSPNNAERIRSGAFLALIRAWEKDAQREPFSEMLDHCVKLYDLLARIRFLAATKLMISEHKLDPEDLDKSIAWVTTQAESHRTKLLDQMKLVRKIPSKLVSKH